MAGRERLRVANEVGLTEIPVRVLDLKDAAEIEETVIESNVARQKTAEQRIREYRHLKRVEAAKAADRKGTRTDPPENLPGSGTGDARDLAAIKVGWSGRTAEKAAQVLTAIEEREEADGNMHDVEELRTTLNKRSVDAAYQKAVEFGWVGDQRSRRKSERGGVPERRIAAVYKRATTAAVKIARIFQGEDVANFTPLQNRDLKETLLPLLKWVDSLGRS